jgi:hypothetical protein
MIGLIKNKIIYLAVECQTVVVNLELRSAQSKIGRTARNADQNSQADNYTHEQ